MKSKENSKELPHRVVERLLTYKSILSELVVQGEAYIHSYQLAEQTNNRQALVRRDIMAVKFLGNPSKGYEIEKLLKRIDKKLHLNKRIKVGVIGAGKIGNAVLSFFKEHNTRFEITALFDVDTSKLSNCKNFFDIDKLEDVVENKEITFIILTVPPKSAQEIADRLNATTIKGILNFTNVPLKVNKKITLNRIDIAMEMEKLAFFSH